MAILLIAEHGNDHLSDQTAKALSAALKIGSDVDILVAGKGAKAAADAAAKLKGARKVLLVEADELAERLAEPLAATVVSLAGGYDTIIAPATTMGKNVTPRVAALLDVMQVSEIIEVVSARHLQAADLCRQRHPDRAGDRRQEGHHRAHRFLPGRPEGGSAAVETVEAAANPGLSTFVENRLSESDRPELTSAKIIISGGRALGSSEKFQEVILPVADKLGAAVGASRAAVDAGYAPNDWQVGQTGKVVAPDLYIACRHFRRHSAPRRHEGFEGHRRHQQGRGSADLPGGRLWHRRRSLRRAAGA